MLVSDRLVEKSGFLSGRSLESHGWRRIEHVRPRVKRREGSRPGEVLACRDCRRKSMLFLRHGASKGTSVDLKKIILETRALKGNEEKSASDWDPLDFEGSKTDQKKNTFSKKDPQQEEQEEESKGVSLALSLLKFYKGNISPLLPPACRYLPTCSEYAMDSFKKFGFAKGGVLTAWRLARCNPLGGSGYDPPKWPPPGLEGLVAFLERKYVGESIFVTSCVLAAIFALERAHPF